MTVSKTEYWPAILADPTQLGQVKTTDDEFNKRAENIFRVLKDSLIKGENKIYLQQWEAELELDAPENATLNDRKAAILYRITCELPSKIDIFQKSLELMLGAGNFEFEHLQDENKLVIHTDRITEQESQAVTDLIKRIIPKYLNVERYNHHIEISWRDINKYALCKTFDDVLAVNADYVNDLTSEGEWVYPMPEMTKFANHPSDWWNGFFYKSPIKKIKAVFPKCTYSHAFLGGASNIEEADLEFPIATRVSAPARSIYKLKKLRIVAPLATASDSAFYWNQCRNQDWYIYYPKTKNMQSMFADCWYIEEIKGEFGMEATNLNYAYKKCPMLRVFPTNYPQAQTADAMFNECQIPGEAAIAVLNSFPSYTSGTHNVTMGIHIDYQNDPDVLEAIENAEAKGWTVTVQWNGTATAAAATTWGMRRPPIYAKLAEVETPEGGTEKVLDWGHYATNAEENGYKEFASVDEAKTYFNITE